MASKIPAAMFWSGGKDSSLTLYRILQGDNYDVKLLVTTVSADYERISMHGVRVELLEQQAKSIGIPLLVMRVPEAPDNSAYELALDKVFGELKAKGIFHVIFGDIFLEDLKAYRDKLMAKAGVIGIYPLWMKNTAELYDQFIDIGFKAVTVSVAKPVPGEQFAGRLLDESFQADLPDEVDPCGEHGEFHTFVFDGPIFSEQVTYELGENVIRQYSDSFESKFIFTDLIPVKVSQEN